MARVRILPRGGRSAENWDYLSHYLVQHVDELGGPWRWEEDGSVEIADELVPRLRELVRGFGLEVDEGRREDA